MEQRPTIKGIFVNSHLKAVRDKLGEEGVRQIELQCGKKISYKNSENVPVSDEVRILDCSIDILRPGEVPPSLLAFESGRLHFQNFSTTPLAKIIFSVFPNLSFL
jgi:uncharacterized protein (TIGR02265 family)